MSKELFAQQIHSGYTFKGDSVILGCAMLDAEAQLGLQVKAPLKTFNRHGLIAGATGTGKTKSLQALAERLSEKGVPVLVMDVKGDLSGIAQSGVLNDRVNERHSKIGDVWKATSFSTELLSISDEPGVRMRATVSEFGPVLFSRVLELNDTQSGVVSLVFKFCDDHAMSLLDLKDFKKALQYLTNEGKEMIEKDYGRISAASTSTIIRKIIEIEEQGADKFFGEKSFDVEDLMRIDEKGRGMVNVIRLTDMQSKPKLFSTFMLCLLAEIYQELPEEGDPDQPNLVVFIDEAHLLFKEASKALLDQLETIIKLIRSKGIGVFFITQSPTDIPASVLGQLGMKIQHALRAFTANDRKAIKAAAENYPDSDFYKVDELLTGLGIGEALVSVLNEKGIPTPLVHTLMAAPQSRMDVLTSDEINQLVAHSPLVKKYNEQIDRESAYEMLEAKILSAAKEREVAEEKVSTASRNVKEEPSVLESLLNNRTTKTVVNTVFREVTRGLLGVLGLTGSRRRRR
jgi:uncharacterized protein